MPEMNMIQALNHTLKEEFKRDGRLVIFGEDAGYFGGVFRVTEGMQEMFGEERCFSTPLSEQGIVGFAIGMAQQGMKPIAEIQFADYIFPAYDQIVNEMAKMRYRTANQYSSPVVIRTPYGGGIHGGHYHSQSPEAQFLHTPGLVVCVASTPYDAKGLLTAAIESNDPVIFFEPKRIYRAVKSEVPLERYVIPFGQAEIARQGKDLTLIGWGAQHHQNMLAAESLHKEKGIDIEVINLRTLNPLDMDSIVISVAKTGRLVIAHEAPLTGGFGAELAAQVQEKCFLHLLAPVKRCCGWDTPFPNTLEHDYLPDAERVKNAAIETVNY
ncbi:alpha-ketoacid dehydrogenase subunit beta [Estrella lausannensis]|uniref:3-methyl-2-oxobutanoate dehydrogenase (2-methylpropanoyl-transferring) n=1 Tax=Estrella lausannensis TaxID=483423 RepID=A0A0H5DQZ4_9BACT|nr:alpha-ketoacid dehydrogenase subunit beta [Estrella lausannensis]CRX39076.1 2-oxoisovalerate dehydrogenase subunit beta, mitochondrial [Estrella lausannensis]